MCTLRFERLPGYEELSQDEYETMMREKLRQRTEEALKNRRVTKSLGPKRMALIKPGALPKKTKVSARGDTRPRVLSEDPKTRSVAREWYFSIYSKYKQCSKRYRSGDLSVEFPKGTYKPPLFTVAFPDTIV